MQIRHQYSGTQMFLAWELLSTFSSGTTYADFTKFKFVSLYDEMIVGRQSNPSLVPRLMITASGDHEAKSHSLSLAVPEQKAIHQINSDGTN